MLFRRRDKLHPIKRLREMVWPSMGWLRTWDYVRHRMFRRSDSAYSITAGLAAGVAVSFSPIMGTHMIQAVILSLATRANIFAAAIGTLFGNPTTLPFIWMAAYKLGTFVLDFFGRVDLMILPDEMSFDFMMKHPYKLFLPMMIGGYMLAILSWFVSYVVCYWPVKQMQKAYHAERLQKLRDKILHREHAAQEKGDNTD